MPLKVRAASFNFENFFSRPILLNRDNATSGPLLQDWALLQIELGKKVYNKARIATLYSKLKRYVVLREDRGRLLSGSKVVAGSTGDWEGWIELKKETISIDAQENTIRALRALDADVVCVVEMDDRATLSDVGKHKLLTAAQRYRHAMLIEGNDARGIDVGVLSRYPIADLVSHVDDEDKAGPIFSRDCLEAKVSLPGGRDLFLLANHLKSQAYGSAQQNDAKRVRQARRITGILKSRYDLKKQYVVIAGDLNVDHRAKNATSIGPLLKHPELVDVLGTLGNDDWTYSYRGKEQRLDYLLCSRALATRLQNVGIERRGMWNLKKITGGAQKPFPEVNGPTTAASDHAGVYADFTLP